jgi:hypothetical protein
MSSPRGQDLLRRQHAGNGVGADDLHGLHRSGDAEVQPGQDGIEPQAQKHALGVQMVHADEGRWRWAGWSRLPRDPASSRRLKR